jgi:hypothetical protein
MNPTNPYQRILCAFTLTLSLCFAGSLGAQDDTLIAMGVVNGSGTLVNSTNTVGGVVSILDQGIGNHDIVIDAVGAFSGSSGDYLLMVAKRDNDGFIYDTDNYVYGNVESVTADQLTATVRSQDLEDASDKNGPLASDTDYNFIIRKVSTGSPTISSDSSHLMALGRVSPAGAIVSSFGVNGVAVSSSGAGGIYEITLARTGAFAGDGINDYVVLPIVRDSSLIDKVVGTSDIETASDDEVVLSIRVHDVQDGGAGTFGNASADDFFFTVFRIPSSSPAGAPKSTLLIAAANISSSGSLVEGASSLPNSVVSATDVATGRYEVDINAPGAFAGKTSNQYVAMATVRDGFVTDNTVSVDAVVLNDNTLRILLSTQDVENDLSISGDLEDEALAVVVYDTDPVFQPDMRIGRKRALKDMKGDDRYNTGGGGQGVRVTLPATGQENFFFAVQNDGASIDNFRVKEKGAGKIVKIKYFRLSGGRKNVTGAVRTGKIAAPQVAPGKVVIFKAQARYRSTSKTPKRNIRLLGTSQFGGSRDTVKATPVLDAD